MADATMDLNDLLHAMVAGQRPDIVSRDPVKHDPYLASQVLIPEDRSKQRTCIPSPAIDPSSVQDSKNPSVRPSARRGRCDFRRLIGRIIGSVDDDDRLGVACPIGLRPWLR